MFYLDRVNRLPKQTQRRVCGCAPLALRRVDAKKKFFTGRVSPNKASETRPIRLNIRPTCSNHDTYISVPLPPTQYRRAILYNTHTIYTLIGGKPVISLFIHPLSKSLLSTCLLRLFIYLLLLFNSLDLLYTAYYPPLFYKGFRLKP